MLMGALSTAVSEEMAGAYGVSLTTSEEVLSATTFCGGNDNGDDDGGGVAASTISSSTIFSFPRAASIRFPTLSVNVSYESVIALSSPG